MLVVTFLFSSFLSGLAFSADSGEIKQDFKDSGHSLKQGFKKTGHGIKKGAKKTGRSFKKGGKAFKDEIKK